MERIGDTVASELRRNTGDAARALTEITRVWEAAVGDTVARQAWPMRIGRDGTLHVATSSSTWAFELDRLSGQITERLTALVGRDAPPALRFRPGPIPEPGQAADRRAERLEAPLEVRPETAALASAFASAIEDPELRRIVAKAARASLARAGSGRQI